VALVQGDVLVPGRKLLEEHKLPTEFPAVLIDVPCSNTGVMSHRVDVRWRLQENDFQKHSRQQLAMLSTVSMRVALGGRLVYSTCSLEPEENEHVVGLFLEKNGTRFVLEKTAAAQPWVNGHDGASAFLLRRKA